MGAPRHHSVSPLPSFCTVTTHRAPPFAETLGAVAVDRQSPDCARFNNQRAGSEAGFAGPGEAPPAACIGAATSLLDREVTVSLGRQST
jgi:hypothetical protein